MCDYICERGLRGEKKGERLFVCGVARGFAATLWALPSHACRVLVNARSTESQTSSESLDSLVLFFLLVLRLSLSHSFFLPLSLRYFSITPSPPFSLIRNLVLLFFRDPFFPFSITIKSISTFPKFFPHSTTLFPFSFSFHFYFSFHFSSIYSVISFLMLSNSHKILSLQFYSFLNILIFRN